MFDIFHEIGQTLSRNKSRTALTGLAVAWGIFMLIVLLGMSRGVQGNFVEFASSPETNTINVWGGWTSKPYKGYQEWRRIPLEDQDQKIVKDRGNGMIKDVVAEISIDTAKIYSDREYLSSGPTGVSVREMMSIQEILYGRLLNQRDIDESRRSMVIESRNAELLFGDASQAVGKIVKCMGLSWRIVGVYKHNWKQNSYIPYSTAKALRGGSNEIDELNVYLESVTTKEEGEAAERNIKSSLAYIHEFDPEDNSAVYVWNRFVSTLEQLSMMSIMDMVVWIIGMMTLISGIVGVSNIMFVSVKERTHEIGIRRAIGAKPFDIVKQIILEGIVITSLFGYIGIVLGTFITELIGHFLKESDAGFVPTIDLSIALKVMVVLIIAGGLAALFPALKATKVKPVEALRDE